MDVAQVKEQSTKYIGYINEQINWSSDRNSAKLNILKYNMLMRKQRKPKMQAHFENIFISKVIRQNINIEENQLAQNQHEMDKSTAP